MRKDHGSEETKSCGQGDKKKVNECMCTDQSSLKFLQVQLLQRNLSIDEFVVAPGIYRELWTTMELASATCEMDFSRKYYGELWSSRETIES
jgi:hypothetical protein